MTKVTRIRIQRSGVYAETVNEGLTVRLTPEDRKAEWEHGPSGVTFPVNEDFAKSLRLKHLSIFGPKKRG